MKFNKILIFMFILLGLVTGVSALAEYPYDVANATYTGLSLLVSAQDTIPNDVEFNNDGSKMFMLGSNTNDRVNEYDCSVNYNITSCVYSTRFFDFAAEIDLAYGMTFNNDGSKVYVSGPVADRTYQYNCTTNFKMDTCTYSGLSLSTIGQDSTSGGITFNSDGSKYYMVGSTGDKVYEYDCTTNYKINTCTYSTRFLSVSAQDLTPRNLNFNNDGSLLFVLGKTGDDISQYDCTTNYKVDTCTFSLRSLLLTGQDTSPNGFTFNNDGSRFYMVGQTTDTIYQYSIDFPVSELSFTNITINDETLVNNSFFNTTTNLFETFVLNSSTNGNVNHSYSINGGSYVQFGTNNLNASVNITQIEGSYNISFLIINDETNTTSDNFTYTIDTTAPVIVNNIADETNSYLVLFNSSTCTDTNIDTCSISINSQTKDLFTDNNITSTLNGNISYTITATDLAGNSLTENGVVLVNPLQCNNFFISNGTAITNYVFNSITYASNPACLSTYGAGLVLGSNTYLFEKLGFASTNITFTVNTTNELNLSHNITESKIVISIFDRQTGNLLTGLTSIIILATNGFNGTTTTGLLNVSNVNFISEQYQILAEHTGYNSESVYFNYNNQEILAVNIYMLNSTELGQIKLIVKNSLSQFIEDAVCSVLEWKPTLSSYVSVGQGLTNINGETILNIELNSKIYKFTCTKLGFTTTSNAQIVQVDNSQLTIILDDVVSVPDVLFPNLVTSMTNTTLNATHQLITYNFADGDGLTTQACIKYYYVNGNRRVYGGEQCVASSTGEILLTLDVNSTTGILVQGVLTTDAVTDYVTNQIQFKGVGNIADQFKIIGLDVLIPTILVLIGLALGIAMSKIEIAAVLVAIAGWVSVAFVPTIMKSSIAMFITVIVGLMLWGGYKGK